MEVKLIPNKYLSDEKDIWKLKQILGEKHYHNLLEEYEYVIDEYFIYNAFMESNQTFYISFKVKRIYASLNEITKNIDGILPIPLVLLLNYVDVNQIEQIIEKAYIKY